MESETLNGDKHTSTAISLPMEAAMTKNYGADLKHIVMCSWNDGHILSLGDKHVSYPEVFIGSGALEMLSLRMVHRPMMGPNNHQFGEVVAVMGTMQRTSVELMYSSTPMVSGCTPGASTSLLKALPMDGMSSMKLWTTRLRYSPFLMV